MNTSAKPSIEPMDLKELTVVLLKHHGIHSGIYEISLNFDIGAGAGQPPSSAYPVPTIFTSVTGVGLNKIEGDAPKTSLAVDAAEVNPAPPAT